MEDKIKKVFTATSYGKTTSLIAISDIVDTYYTFEDLKKDFCKRLRDLNTNLFGVGIEVGSLKAKDPRECHFFMYTPVFEKQKLYQKIPFVINEETKTTLIDAFACIGTKFGLDSLDCFVEIKSSEMGSGIVWAEVYYVSNSLYPALIIECNEFVYF